MKSPFLFTLFVVIFSTYAYSQNTCYVASKSGLNMRERADANAAVITKIPYGEKIQWTSMDYTNKTTSEGMNVNWLYITYAGKKGFVADVYTLPIPPPSASIELKDYANKLGKATGTWTNGAPSEEKFSLDREATRFEKILYDNGVVYRSAQGYEWNEKTIWIPDMNIERAFILARLLSSNSYLLNTNDKFPRKSITLSGDIQKTIHVVHFYENNTIPEKVRFEICEAECQWIEIRSEAGEISITFGSGV